MHLLQEKAITLIAENGGNTGNKSRTMTITHGFTFDTLPGGYHILCDLGDSRPHPLPPRMAQTAANTSSIPRGNMAWVVCTLASSRMVSISLAPP